MKINVNNLRVGHVIEIKDVLYRVLHTQHVKPGKGPAYLQTTLRNLQNNSKTQAKFRTEGHINKVSVMQKEYQFMYQTQDDLVLLDVDSGDQCNISVDLLGDDLAFLQDNAKLILDVYDQRIIAAQIANTVVMSVESTENVIRGQTATPGHKPAILTNGQKIMVPSHVQVGDRVEIRVSDRTYLRKIF